MLKKAATHLVIIAACLLGGIPAMAEPYIQADLSYQNTATSSGSTSTESYSFVQGYSMGFSKFITNTITLNAEARLTETDRNGQKSETLYPMVSLNYLPPSIYYFSFGYNRTETGSSEGSRLATSNLSSSFALPLERFPSLAASFNRTTSQDYNIPHQVDNVSTAFGVNSSYNFTLLQTDTLLNYSFSQQKTEDMVSLSKTEAPSHNATVDVTRFFLERKLRTSLRAGYSWSENTSTSLAGPTQFEQKLAISEGLFKITSNHTGSLDKTTSLIDGNTSTQATTATAPSTGIDLNGTDRNIGFGFLTSQKVEKIYIYITTSDANISSYADSGSSLYSFGFQLYTSSNGTSWTLASAPAVSFDGYYSRLVFTFTETEAQYFKIVNTNYPAGASAITVNEIEAYGFLTSTPMLEVTNITTREFAGITLSYVPSSRLALNYGMNYDHSTQSVSASDTVSTNHGVSLNYVAVPQYLTVTTNYTRTNNSSSQGASESTTSSQNGVDSYTLTFSSNPLPTMSGNINYGHFISTSGGAVSSTTNTLAGNLFLILYKGANLGLTSSFSAVENPAENSTTDSLSNTANLYLVPWRGVNVTINTGLSSSETSQEGSSTDSDTYTLNASLSYTPTRRLYFSALYSLEPTASQSYLVNWTPTNTIQTGARLGLTDNVVNYGLNLS